MIEGVQVWDNKEEKMVIIPLREYIGNKTFTVLVVDDDNKLKGKWTIKLK